MARCRLILAALLTLVSLTSAHEHHDELSEEDATAPIDSLLWIHIFLQAAVWGVLFPIGMVLGLSKSRWHVPVQVRWLPLKRAIHLLTIFQVDRIHLDLRRLYPGPQTRRTEVPPLCTRENGESPSHSNIPATWPGDLLETPLDPIAFHSRQMSQGRRYPLPNPGMDANAFRVYGIYGIL